MTTNNIKTAEVVPILRKIELSSASLRKTEKRIADTIMAHPEQVVLMSISRMAKQSDVSEPTILRFVRKLGCKGYSDFKMQLAQEAALSQMFVNASAVAANTKMTDIVQRLQTLTVQALTQTAVELDIDAIDLAATKIGESKMVYCFGTGGSSAIMAKEAENRLFRLGVSAQSSSDSYRHLMTATIVEAVDVLLIFSATGKPKSLVSCAQEAVKRGAVVVVVTRPSSPLASAATIVIGLDTADHETYFNLPTQVRYAQMFALDCLASHIAILRPESVENLSRIRNALSKQHGHVKRQPIGD